MIGKTVKLKKTYFVHVGIKNVAMYFMFCFETTGAEERVINQDLMHIFVR
jgi:hypothetical protein